MIGLKTPAPLLLLALVSAPAVALAASPFELDLKELDRQSQPAPQTSKKKVKAQKGRKRASGASKAVRHEQSSGDYFRYTVRPGDHIFKILMSHFGMSNETAERLIPEIIRINNINNIKNLTVGETLLIPKNGRKRQIAREQGKPQQAETREQREVSKAQTGGEAPQSAALRPQPAPVRPQPPPQPPGRNAEAAAMLDQAKKLEAEGERERVYRWRIPEASQTPPPVPELRAKPVPLPEYAAPAVPVIPPPLASPAAGTTLICSVAGADTPKLVDSVLNALSTSWSKNKIIDSEPGAPNAFSIRVDRYFEYKGGKYIINVGDIDPYTYTLIRLLETAGHKATTIASGEPFQSAVGKLLKLVGVARDYGKHLLAGGKERTGYLVRQEDAGGRQVLITEEPADPRQQWVMKPECR